MKTATRTLLAALIALAFAQLASAQMMGMGGPPSFAGVFTPTVGSGSSYEMVDKDGTGKTNFDIYVVDKEAGGYWIEYAMQNSRSGGPMYMKSLMTRQGDDIMMQRMIMQMPGHPQPMEMTSMMKMHPMQSKESKADIRTNAQNMGTETITTPAGSFSCQHWRSAKDGTDVWLSDKVTPWNLVKMTSPKSTMTLVKVITGAKTHITGTPMSMEDMMKGHMGQQQ